MHPGMRRSAFTGGPWRSAQRCIKSVVSSAQAWRGHDRARWGLGRGVPPIKRPRHGKATAHLVNGLPLPAGPRASPMIACLSASPYARLMGQTAALPRSILTTQRNQPGKPRVAEAKIEGICSTLERGEVGTTRPPIGDAHNQDQDSHVKADEL